MISEVLDILLAVAFPFHRDHSTFFPTALSCLFVGFLFFNVRRMGFQSFCKFSMDGCGKVGRLLLYILGFVHGGA